MRTKYAIFSGTQYANRDGFLKGGQPTYMFNPFIEEESTFDTVEQAKAEGQRIGLTGFAVLQVYFG